MTKWIRSWQGGFLAVLIAVGAAVAWGIGLTVTVSFVDSLAGPRQPSTSLAFLADGTAVLRTQSFGSHVGYTITSLDGKPIDDKSPADLVSGTWVGLPRPTDDWELHCTDNSVVVYSDHSGANRLFWYLIDEGGDQDNAYFAGYDPKSRLCVGYIGRQGFQAARPLGNERFSIRGVRGGFSGGAVAGNPGIHWYASYNADSDEEVPSEAFKVYVVYLLSGNELVAVDLRNRSVRMLRKSDDIKSIQFCSQHTERKTRKGTSTHVSGRTFLGARTDGELIFLDANGEQVERLELPESLQHTMFQFYRFTNDTAAAVIRPGYGGTSIAEGRYTVLRFDQQSKVTDTQTVALPGRARRFTSSVWFGVIAMPLPVLVVPSLFLSGGPSGSLGLLILGAVFSATVWGVLPAWYCYRRQRRFDQPWTWLWAAFVLLCGVPGLIGYLFRRRWPALDACPGCRTEAPRDREACYSCGQDFPRPTPRGTEIFA